MTKAEMIKLYKKGHSVAAIARQAGMEKSKCAGMLVQERKRQDEIRIKLFGKAEHRNTYYNGRS